MEKVLLTVEEAAERLSIGRTMVYQLMGSGLLGSVTIGRCRRIPADAVDRFVRSLDDAGDSDALRTELRPLPGTELRQLPGP